MRNMSFLHTWDQFSAMEKTETCRVGWGDLAIGERIQGVKKCMGLKKGEHVEKGHVIIVKKVEAIFTEAWFFTKLNVISEGFPELTPYEFVYNILIAKCKINHGRAINRITFEYEVKK